MYKITKSKKTVKNDFATYELARQYLRKILRKKTTERTNGQPSLLGMHDIAIFGYDIKRVD
jgi:hypothetical protein